MNLNQMEKKMRSLIKILFALTVTFAFIAGCQQHKPDASQELRPLVDKYVEVWNNGNVDELDAIMDINFVRNADASSAEGLDNLRKLVTGTRTAFPDIKLVLNNEIYTENSFAARFSFTATNTGPGEMPPTGKSVEVWGVVIANFANGKMTEEWVGYNNQSFMEQLGFTMMPPTARTDQ